MPGYRGTVLVRAIRERRSVRDGFTEEPISRDLIEEIVTSGLSAPSSKNAQPWRIHVVTQRDRLDRIAAAVRNAKHADDYAPLDPATGRPREWNSTVSKSAEVLGEAGIGLFVENTGRFSSGRKTVAEADHEYREDALVGYSFELIGLGAMIQNMWLTAHVRGLRGVFMGDVLVAEPEIRELLDLRGDLAGVLALGYSTGDPVPKKLEPDRVRWHS